MNRAGQTESSASSSDRTLPPSPDAESSAANKAPALGSSAGDTVPPAASDGENVNAACPSCGKPVRIDRRRLKPGKFRLRCGSCKQPFGLLVNERMEVRVGKLAQRSSTSGDQDDLPPEIAATLMMNRPAAPRPVSRRSNRGSMVDSGITTSPDESGQSMSGSFTAVPTETLSGISASGSMSGVTAAPESGPRDFITPPSHVGPTLPPPEVNPGDRLDGYELRKKLGEGGMGAVYLARQVSLDRSVALKVLSPKLSGHPALVSRFMREAYAAGQLVHHNVVQIYDFGKDRPRRGRAVALDDEESAVFGGPARSSDSERSEIHFFSMEFVDGASLQNLVKERGRLDPREAVSLLLQAARGLSFAHEHGIIHRDIKPDNLMVNRHGIVKVADLGLVKQLGGSEPAGEASEADADAAVTFEPESGSISAAAAAQITQVSQMMGTPAYMPPEQASDAKSADARADIYSLGCTLYHLVIGHPPFGGKTLQDVLEAHRSQKVRFPDPMEGGPKISTHLKEIIRRMCAKTPKERFSSMDRVIRELEIYLEEKHQAAVEPDEQQKKTLAWAAQQFSASTWGRMRPLIIAAFLLCVGGALILAPMMISDAFVAFGAIGGLLGMVVMAFFFGFVLGGRRRRDVIYTRARELFFGAGLLDWMFGVAAFALLITVLINFNWHFWWLGAAGVALVLAWAWQAIVDRGVQADQQPMVTRAERVLREMREAGIEEARIRRAVAEAAGKHWEAFYEALFGYEAKLQARDTYGVDEKGIEKPRYAAFRDPILSWLNDRLEKRRIKRDQRFLKGLHKNELLAQGVNPNVADKAALNQARREIGQAALLREQIMEELRRELRAELLNEQRAKEEDEEEGEEGKKRRRSKKIKYTDADFERIHETYFRRRFGTPWDILLGQQVRFAIAAALLLCFALWFGQNQAEIFQTISDSGAQEVAVGPQPEAAPTPPWWKLIWTVKANPSEGEPAALELLGLDPSLTLPLSGFHVGLAGFLMMMAAFFYGRAVSISTIAAAVVIMIGVTYFMPPEWKWISIASGALLWALSVFFLRTSED